MFLKRSKSEEKTVDASLYAPIDAEINTKKSAEKFSASEKKKIAKELKEIKKKFPSPKQVSKTTNAFIPYIDTYEGGIFQHKDNRYTAMFEIEDLNYSITRDEGQVSVFQYYSELLNYFPSDMRFQIFLNNSKADIEKFKKRIFMPINVGDGLDKYRKEYNEKIILRQISKSKNDIERTIYIIVSMKAANIIEALDRFNCMEFDLVAICKNMGTVCRKLSSTERLEILHNIYRHENVGDFNKDGNFDYNKIKSRGINTKKYIAPVAAQVKAKHCTVENRYVKTLFITNQSIKNNVNDEFITNFTQLDIEMNFSMFVEPVSEENSAKLLKKQILGMESNLLEEKKKLLRSIGDSTMVNQQHVEELEEAKELRQSIQQGERMFFVTFTIAVYAKTQDELNKNIETVYSVARRLNVEAKVLEYQQLDALIQTLPYCEQTLKGIERTLTTQSLAIFLPFRASNIHDEKGVYCGMNTYTNKMIIADRHKQANPNGYITGVPGAGKSFSAKREIFIRKLEEFKCDILIIDPEREYREITEALGGEVIVIDNNSESHLNPFELMEGDTIENKIDLIISIVEQMKGKEGINGQEFGILNRCIRIIYQKFSNSRKREDLPILKDLYDKLNEQPEKEAKSLAVTIEGYLDSFLSHRSNVDINNKMIVFDINELYGTHNETIGLLLTLDACWNRIFKNRAEEKYTYLFIDEIYLLYENEYSANYLYKLWKRSRKYYTTCTGITQNVEDMLRSDKARTMLGNSEYLYILRQAHSDVEKFQEILELSDRQCEYLKRASVGQGLMKIGNNIVPFTDDFPQDTEMYKLMNTKPKEKVTLEKT